MLGWFGLSAAFCHVACLSNYCFGVTSSKCSSVFYSNNYSGILNCQNGKKCYI